MASWVAPIVAAEMWGVSLEQIMAGIADGSIPSHMEGNFLFVATGSAALHHPAEPTAGMGDAIITPEEREALSISEEEDNSDRLHISQWRLARYRASLLRCPPKAA
jgi:hypothetical protein